MSGGRKIIEGLEEALAFEKGRHQTAVLEMHWRPDGGLRVRSPTHPGLVLSHSDPDKVMLDVLPVLAEMGFAPPSGT